MKSILKIQISVVVALSLLPFYGCKDSKYSNINNAVYFTESQSDISKKVVVDGTATETTFSLRLAEFAISDVTVNFALDTASLGKYNRDNGTNYLSLPEKFFSLPKTSATIKTGTVASEQIVVKINSFDATIATSDKYAIPIKIKSIAGGVPALESSKELILILDRVIITPVVVMNGNQITITLAHPLANLGAWSFEFLCRMDGFAVNNCALFYAYNDEIYSRFGDVVIKTNQLQVKTMGGQPASNTLFTANTWYHIAVVYDGAAVKFYVNGVLDVNTPAALPGYLFNLQTMGFGNTSNTKGQFAELRFWTTAISQTQILNNMYAINPKTPGLELYFKLNEGTGGTFNDATGHGHMAVASLSSNTVWFQNVRLQISN